MTAGKTAKKGNCAITQKPLFLHDMECHHIKPRKGGKREDNSYKNLILLCGDAHKIVTVAKESTIRKYLAKINPNEKQLDKINKLRKLAELTEITV